MKRHFELQRTMCALSSVHRVSRKVFYDPKRVLGDHVSVCIAWSPDGTQIASIRANGGVCTLSARSGLPKFFFGIETYCLAWSPDGAQIVLGCLANTVEIWNAVTGLRVHVFRYHDSSVMGVAWSPDGATIASCSRDATVRLWDTIRMRPGRVLRGHESMVVCVAWSPDGALIASGSHDKTVRLWDAVSGLPSTILLNNNDWVRDVAWSPDGTQIAICSGFIVKLWNAVSGLPGMVLRGHSQLVRNAAWLPDSVAIISCSIQSVRLCAVNTNLPDREFTDSHSWYSNMDLSPNGKTIAIGCHKGVAIIPVCPWSDRDNRLFGPHVRSIVFYMMCVRHRLEQHAFFSRSPPVMLPKLPMVLWLLIFELLLLC